MAIAVVLSACAVASRPGADAIEASASFGAIPLFTADAKPVKTIPGATISGDAAAGIADVKELNVLAISGGGSDGAFGAGVLKGWSETGKRPSFNIVTGVSTGALIASFAFLGPVWDAQIERFYTHVKNEEIYTKNGIGGFFQDGLYDTAPLRKKIEQVVGTKLLEAVAAEHRKGRRLYVATTDLDNGTLVVWDLGGIAASDHPDRLETYRDVLVASAALPGFFKPVYVRDREGGNKVRMHVDGGVKAPILLRSFMVDGPAKKKAVYMLVNGKLSLRAGAAAVEPTVLDISKRSIAELMRGLTYKTIYQGYVTTRRSGADFRLLHIPDEVRDIDDGLRFNPAEMRRLFEVGHRIGRDPANWLPEPPRLEPLERIETQQSPRATRPRATARSSEATR